MAASTASPLVSASPASLPTTTIVVGSSTAETGNLPLWVGQDTGIFQQNGLDVQLQVLNTSANSVPALLSGQVQFIQTGASAALGPAAHGADLTVLAIWIPVYNYVVDVAPAIQTAQDLKGKTFAGDAIGGTVQLATSVALQHLGLDPANDVTLINVRSTPERVGALLSGQVQGAVLSPPDNFTVESQGYTRLLDMAALHIPAAGQSTIADKAWVSQNKDVVQRYVDAMLEATHRAKTDKATALASMKSRMQGYTDDQISQTYDFYAGEVFPDFPSPDPGMLSDAVQALGQQDAAVASLDLSTLLDPSFVQEAQAQGIP